MTRYVQAFNRESGKVDYITASKGCYLKIAVSVGGIGVQLGIIDFQQSPKSLDMAFVAMGKQNVSNVVSAALYLVEQPEIHVSGIDKYRIPAGVSHKIGVRESDD
jgi:hypothetical protein